MLTHEIHIPDPAQTNAENAIAARSDALNRRLVTDAAIIAELTAQNRVLWGALILTVLAVAAAGLQINPWG